MKKILTLTFIACILLCGYALADVGIPSVPETQGIVTSTSLNAVGNFATATEIQWRSTNAPVGLPNIPPLATERSGIYESTYTEDTQSHGVGLMMYDKELDVETSDQITGQWNIEATKQIAFIGIDGAHVVSSDAIMVDGASTSYYTPFAVVCPFAADETLWTPYYCNRAEAGSTIDMTVANARTTTTDRFVMSIGPQPNPAAGSGNVELNHDIRVTELVADVPSSGLASAYLDVLVQEARGFQGTAWAGPGGPPNTVLMERIEFSEETSADGAVTLFEKLMHYESGIVR
ncbi:MAG: hypothetical protein GKC07_03815 [Methanomicrobiales archaeon]|nr:hypothetical protein [Methanomicrobiales archaeon]